MVHFAAVGVDHIELAQREFAGDGLHHHLARAGGGGLGVDGERHILTGGIHEQLIGRLRRFEVAPIHGQQVIAFLHLHAGLGERRAQAGVPVFPGIDFLEAVKAAGRVEFIVHAQQAEVDGMQIGIIAAAHVGVGVGKFADHLAQQVGEVVAVRHVGQQRGITVALRGPIDAVHGLFEEEVALLPPDFVEHLFPFGARVDPHFQG